jgi:hypothetical protein
VPEGEDPDAALFAALLELVCPITHAVFLDPVLTCSGHAYERAAIEEHRRARTDPLSRAPLDSAALTPVFVLRERAATYREHAARACAERAAAPRQGADEPARFLRRVAELADGLSLPGFTDAVKAYAAAHPSLVFDRALLDLFASELAVLGYRERAAAVYFHLLTAGGDRTERAALLRRCLACWMPAGDAPASSVGGGRALVATRPARGADIGDEALGRLAAALALPRARSVGWVFDVAAEAGLGDGFAARLCERILFPPAAPPGAAGDKGEEEEALLPWATEKELLVRFVRALTGELTTRQDAADEELAAALGRGGRRGPRRALARPPWLSHPAFVAAAVAAAALADGAHPLARCSRALPLLLLLPEK